jgi:2-polyprenyl-3-methyl-5-hydroxy-6-metoxy-1,4-benzoquinol methylase
LPALLRNRGCHVTAVDNVSDYWEHGRHSLINRHWLVIDDDIRRPTTLRSRFDLISCISVIEHIDDPAAALRSIIKLLEPGRHLVLN